MNLLKIDFAGRLITLITQKRARLLLDHIDDFFIDTAARPE